MKTKYYWSGVPKNITWIATDLDGVANGFNSKPFKDDHNMWSLLDGSWKQLGSAFGYKGNWQDSLEERPSEND